MSLQPAWTRSAVLDDSSITPAKLAAGAVTSDKLGGRERLRQFLGAMATARVDIVALGDSNQNHFGGGWDHGWQHALSTLGIPMYATGLLSPYVNEGAFTSLLGYTFRMFAYPAGSVQTGDQAPGLVGASFSAGSPHKLAYIPSGSSVAAATNRGHILDLDSALGLESRLRFHYSYGTFDSGSGAFQPAIRLDAVPYTSLARADAVATNTGTVGVASGFLDLAASGGRTGPLLCGFNLSGGSGDIVGPAALGWTRVENRDRKAGYSYSSMYSVGGQSLRDFLWSLLNEWTPESLAHYFTMVRAQQVGARRVIIAINSGFNDRAEDLASLGPNPVAGADSPEAYADNLRGIIARIEGVWQEQGWDLGELCFAVTPSHPIDEPDDAEIISYIAAAREVAATNARVAVLALHDVADEDLFLLNDWYYVNVSDQVHLKEAGFEGAARLLLASASDLLAARHLAI